MSFTSATTLLNQRELLNDARVESMNDLFMDLPLELIEAIFTIAVADASLQRQSTESPPDYSIESARAPYRIASVCRDWRNLARQCPSLWTYIGAPQGMSESHIEYISTNLKLSSQTPLDIILNFIDSQPAVAAFNLIARHVDRWRRCFLLSLDPETILNWDCLSAPTPFLEVLVMVTNGHRLMVDQPTVDQGGFLPAAPRLRQLNNHALCAAPVQQWPVLVHLTLNLRDATNESLWKTLTQTPNVNEVRLLFQFNLTRPPLLAPSHDINLPHLETITLLGRTDFDGAPECVSRLKMPGLRNVIISSYGCDALGSFFKEFSHQVHNLCIIYENPSHLAWRDAQVLRCLINLETITILGNGEPGPDGMEFVEFFETLAEPDDHGGMVFSQLREMKIDGCGFLPDDYQGLLAFLRLHGSPQRPLEFILDSQESMLFYGPTFLSGTNSADRDHGTNTGSDSSAD